MPSLVIANTSLASGGIARIKHSWTTANTGEMSYSATYACLAEYATKWITSFTTGSQPPLEIPSALRSLQLTRTPDLADLNMETANGMTYFNAIYTAGVASDVTITQSSEVRNISWVSAYIGNTRIISSFDYISNSVRITGTNAQLPVMHGAVGTVFNARNVDVALVISGGVPNLAAQTIEQTSTTRNGRGEYINSVTSTGIYVAYDVDAPASSSSSPISITKSVSQERITTQTAAYGNERQYPTTVGFKTPLVDRSFFYDRGIPVYTSNEDYYRSLVLMGSSNQQYIDAQNRFMQQIRRALKSQQ